MEETAIRTINGSKPSFVYLTFDQITIKPKSNYKKCF